MRVRVLVVEDEPELAAMVAAALRDAGFTVDGCGRADEALAALAGDGFDAVLLDLGLPDGDGLVVLRQLRRSGSGVPVLVLTARDGVLDRIAGLDGGADDYVLKPFHLSEVVARVRALLRRPQAVAPAVLQVGPLAFHTALRRAVVDGQPLVLSRRELALVELLMRRSGQVLTRETIEAAVYGYDDTIGSNAVEVLVHRVRRKLEDAGAGPCIHTLRGIGYLFEPHGA